MKTIVSGTDTATTSRMLSGVSSLLAAIAFAGLSTTGNAGPIVDQHATLPRVSLSEADKLCLKRWRDVDTNKEVRRAQAVNPYKARLVIRNDTGERISYSLKWGASGKWESYIVDRRTRRLHAYPLAKASVPHIRFENTGGDPG